MTDGETLSTDYGATVTRMSQALLVHDLESLMAHYDDSLVFVDSSSGERLNKAGLRDYMHRLWQSQPDFAVRLVASHRRGQEFVAVLEASATLASPATGERGQVTWVIVAIYTFDPATHRVLREVTFSDDEALQRRLDDLGLV